ncbi:hypothetical protein HK104_004967 [Borealophlyctis nickersoniae]|nr:hypothetical protein HK104_004967 [Borealophlyctis nickersoniae]
MQFIKKRSTGKFLTQEEVDMVLRVYVQCKGENNAGWGMGGDAVRRAGRYCGVSHSVVREFVGQAERGQYPQARTERRRGKKKIRYGKYYMWTEDIERFIRESNRGGKAVTVNKIRKFLTERVDMVFGVGDKTISRMGVYRTLRDMGYCWERAGKKKCYKETQQIWEWRADYLRKCMDIRANNWFPGGEKWLEVWVGRIVLL